MRFHLVEAWLPPMAGVLVCADVAAGGSLHDGQRRDHGLEGAHQSDVGLLEALRASGRRDGKAVAGEQERKGDVRRTDFRRHAGRSHCGGW